MSYRSRLIASKRNALRSTLFRAEGDPTYLSTEGTPARVRYVLKDPKDTEIARATWADHGVCLPCGQRSIMAGRCLTCGTAHQVPAAFTANGGPPSLALAYGPILAAARRRLAGGV